MAEIDTLEVKIKANAQSAATSLNYLAASLRKVQTALSTAKKDGGDATQRISKGLNDLNDALSKLNNRCLTKLDTLSDKLNKYADALERFKKVKGIGNITNTMKAVDKVLSAPTRAATKKAVDAVKEKLADTPSDSMKVTVASETKGLSKFGEEIAAVRERIKELIKTSKGGTSALGTFVKSLGRIAFYRAIRSAIKAVSEAFSEGLKNAYMYSKQSESFTRLAETLDRIKSITAQMTNQLGAFWGEVRQFVLPAIEWIVEKVRVLSKNLTELFAALNGETTYLVARYQALEWEEATDAVKKYKHQLLGLDELNNLSTQQNSGKNQTDYSQLYDEFEVSARLKAIGASWGSIVTTIKGYADELELFLTGAEIAMGGILLFSGVNIPLGLGLLVHGAWKASEKIPVWNEISGKIDVKLSDIEELLSGAMAAVGAVLLFSGAAPQWGLGLMIAGIGLFSDAKKRKTDWTKIDTKTSDALSTLNKTFGLALGVIGGVLLFSGASIGLGLGCLIAGISAISSDAKEKTFSFSKVSGKINKVLETIKGSLLLPIGLAAVGAALLFTGHYGLGLGLLIGSKVLADYEITEYGWDSVLKNLQTAWGQIRAYVKGTIQYDLNSWHNKLEEFFDFDLNGDTKVGGLPTKAPKVVEIGGKNTLDYFTIPAEPKIQTPTAKGLAIQNLEKAIYENTGGVGTAATIQGQIGIDAANIVKGAVAEFLSDPIELIKKAFPKLRNNSDSDIRTFMDYYSRDAHGAVESRGSLFLAGEAGPEFIGSIGSTSAVANTGQMTDAIYKAAYMGMSRALQENGGNGLAGFVPATTDDLFIAMRKKASKYNKTTGNSAFA